MKTLNRSFDDNGKIEESQETGEDERTSVCEKCFYDVRGLCCNSQSKYCTSAINRDVCQSCKEHKVLQLRRWAP